MFFRNRRLVPPEGRLASEKNPARVSPPKCGLTFGTATGHMIAIPILAEVAFFFGDAMPPTGTEYAEFNIDQVMEELAGGVKKLPEQALRTAQAHRDAMIPPLIACIEQATAHVAAGTGVQGNAHFFALFLSR